MGDTMFDKYAQIHLIFNLLGRVATEAIRITTISKIGISDNN